MKPRSVHCFFEQSGTFRDAFRQLNIMSFDYDIENRFGKTDIVVDLFTQIEYAYTGRESIFDYIQPNDLIFAFFPCIYFNEHNEMYFCGTSYNFRNMHKVDVLRSIISRSDKRQSYYRTLLKFVTVCVDRNLPLIVENPYNAHHYLRFNFPFVPAVIDMNRTIRGDYFKKPTQYFFVNIVPGKGRTIQKIRKMSFVQE